MADLNYSTYEENALKKRDADYAKESARVDGDVTNIYKTYQAGGQEAHDTAVAAVNKEKEGVGQQYAKLYDTNALQELVSRRQLQEAMANAGLTDSGLNRTQNTAISLMRGNADRDTQLAQQSAVDKLTQQLAQMEADWKKDQSGYLAGLLNQASQQKTGLYGSLTNNADNTASDLYGTDLSAALTREREATAAAQWQKEQSAKQAQWDRENAIAAQAATTTAETAAIKSIMEKTNLNDDDAQVLLAFLRSGGNLDEALALVNSLYDPKPVFNGSIGSLRMLEEWERRQAAKR